MDSRDVSKALRVRIRPELKKLAFSQFTGRKCWRRVSGCTQVVDFAALGSYLAESIGTTPYSFGCHLGLFFHCMAGVPWGQAAIPDRPHEVACQARRFLLKSLPQRELPRRDIWYVDDRGENLEVVMNDVLHVLESQAMPWFTAMSDLESALNAFERQKERFEERGIAVELLGGQPGSYNRASIASALAFSLGQTQRAIAAWETMLANPYYARHEDLKGKAVAAIQWIRSEN